MIQERKRGIAVSPRKQIVERIIAPVNSRFGDLDFEKKDETGVRRMLTTSGRSSQTNMKNWKIR